MTATQPAILSALAPSARYVELSMGFDVDPRAALRALAARAVDDSLVVGVGPSLAKKLGADVPGLRAFASVSGPGCDVPSTQCDLWLWVRGDDRGRILKCAHEIESAVAPAFTVQRSIDAFVHDGGRDLTGYEDGTENPKGKSAHKAALIAGQGAGFDGGSFVAVQKWVHDLRHFASLSQRERDNVIGRRQKDNEELARAPSSAHVKRTAQESFDPEAFVLRRSMPWADSCGEGLLFVAFGRSFDAFEAQLRRMTGHEDGVVDALFRFSKPVTGSYFFCPPVRNGKLDLRALGM
ncbi:MAG: Dyp-type peroxidase [Polyangiales bacterium]